MFINTQKLKEQLLDINIEATKEQLTKVDLFCEILVSENQKYNLTSLTEEEEIRQKHILDSLLLPGELLKGENITLADIGSGGGFPAIPIKVFYPEIEIIIIDSLKKRIDFCNMIIEKLGLEKISAIHARAEELSHKEEYRGRFDICTARAVASMPILCELCMPYVKVGGKFIAYKGSDFKEELAQSENAINILGSDFAEGVEVKTAKLPGTDINRNFIIVNKTFETPDKYPRRASRMKKAL